MNGYYGLETLMEYKGITSNEAFQAYYNSVLARTESQNLNILGFERWDTPQIDFDYEMLEVEDQISVMATVLDLNSEPIPLGGKGFGVLKGSIPRQKALFRIGENDYRKQMIVLQQLSISAEFIGASPASGINNYLTELLFGGLFEIMQAHIGNLSYQVGQMKSARMYTLTDANNPRGIQNISFYAQVPDENVTTLTGTKRWFTNDGKTTEGSASDPVNDLKKVVKKVKDEFGSAIVEVDEESWLADMKHSKWQIAIGYAVTPALLLSAGVTADAKETAAAIAAGLSDDATKAAFKSIIGADEVIYSKTICGVEKYNKTSKKLERVRMRAFNANVYLVHPAGEQGVIKNVTPLRPDSSAIYARIFNNHGIIEYRYDAKHKVQEWVSELTALAVPTRPRTWYYLYTYGS